MTHTNPMRSSASRIGEAADEVREHGRQAADDVREHGRQAAEAARSAGAGVLRDARSAGAGVLRDAQDGAERLSDVARRNYEGHPSVVLGVAVALGLIVGFLAGRMRRD